MLRTRQRVRGELMQPPSFPELVLYENIYNELDCIKLDLDLTCMCH